MTRSVPALVERVGWRSARPIAMRAAVGVAVAALLSGLGAWHAGPEDDLQGPAPVTAPRAQGVVPASGQATSLDPPMPELPPPLPPLLPILAPAARTSPPVTVSPPTAEVPYRFMGVMNAGADRSIVLFGRGRVVTLQGPGPVDDEYAVEGIFEDYLVLRHLPSGAGTFVALAQRLKLVAAPGDPEDSARD